MMRLVQTLVSASSIDKELRAKMDGLTKSEQAHLVGKAVAERAKEKGIESVVFRPWWLSLCWACKSPGRWCA